MIGSPIWNDRLSAPINSVISLLDLKDKNISFTDECINKIIENHTRESGVRELKRQLKKNLI